MLIAIFVQILSQLVKYVKPIAKRRVKNGRPVVKCDRFGLIGQSKFFQQKNVDNFGTEKIGQDFVEK